MGCAGVCGESGGTAGGGGGWDGRGREKVERGGECM